MNPFDYFGKIIVTILAFNTIVKEEINQVRNYKINDKLQQRWAGNTHCPDNMIWEEDPISF